MRRRTTCERGLSESVQLAILFPVVLTLIFGAIQVGVVLAGRAAIRDAAMAGAEVASVSPSVGEGVRVAKDVAERSGIRVVEVSTDVHADLVTVRVAGEVPLALVGLSPVVSASVVLPRYR